MPFKPAAHCKVKTCKMCIRDSPEDQKALRYFSDISDRRNQLMAEYAEKYGPLTIDNAAVSSENAWKWSQQPFPWEKEGV